MTRTQQLSVSVISERPTQSKRLESHTGDPTLTQQKRMVRGHHPLNVSYSKRLELLQLDPTAQRGSETSDARA